MYIYIDISLKKLMVTRGNVLRIAQNQGNILSQYIGRVATPKLVSRNCPRYFQTILIKGEGDWSQNLWEVL